MTDIILQEKIRNKILIIRGQRVMIDRDLAEFYGVGTKVLNQAVKRNIERFPGDFMFQLNKDEAEYLVSQNTIPLRSQIVTLKKGNLKSQIVTSSWGGIRKLPYVFTEHGIAMLSSVLKIKIFTAAAR